MAELRRLGFFGKTLPTKKAKVVTASDFAIAGIIGKFERSYAKAFLVQSPEEKIAIFGNNIFPSAYGSDAVSGFFTNLSGTDGKIYVKAHVGNTGTAIDAVTASSDLDNQQTVAESTITLQDAYEEELAYGASGNRTGYKIANGSRFSTQIAVAGAAIDLSITVDSVSGVRLGDIIEIVSTTTLYRKVTAIDESASTISFTIAVGEVVPVDSVVNVLGFQLQLYRKSLTGIESAVEEDLGQVWCTIAPEVTEFYAPNVFASSQWIKLTKNTTTGTLNEDFPVNVSTVTYLTGGAEGTTPSTADHWNYNLSAFDEFPVRMLCNVESTLTTVNKAGEVYCKNRDDNPKWIYTIEEDLTKSELIATGRLYQRSDDVLGVIVANWLKITDPFANSPTSPPRTVPNGGHVMGNWIRSINNLGVHYVPAVNINPLLGVLGVVGYQALEDQDRTDIANAGVNVIQNIEGTGIVIKNFFTPSTTTEFQFANGILMRSFFFVSVRDSLADTENEPNSFDRIRASADAILQFFYRMWTNGSTRNVPLGETFGRSVNEDGTPTTFDDHVQVQADLFNNPQSSINAGERNLDAWFSYPTPTGSIQIGVGFILR